MKVRTIKYSPGRESEGMTRAVRRQHRALRVISKTLGLLTGVVDGKGGYLQDGKGDQTLPYCSY